MDVIDWSTAQRVGDLIAGSPKTEGPGGLSVQGEAMRPLALRFVDRVSEYSGLAPPPRLPPLEAVDRSGWIAANLQTMRPILESVASAEGLRSARSRSRVRYSWKRPGQDLGPLYDALGAAGGLLLGAQVGAMAGMLSQRVLGQYDLALLDPTVEPRLLLVAPNLVQAARTMRVDGEQLLAWVAIHEITHAVQFSGAPWLREHLAEILGELLEGMQMTVSLGTFKRIPGAVGDARAFAERLRRGELVRLTLGERRWRLVERLQATMSLVEGHAEHVMDAVGAEVLPALPRLRAAMTRRRSHRGLSWRLLERLLGLELKMRQYEQGRAFCDAVVLAGGRSALVRVWGSPETLPTTAELQAPELWLARMA